MTRWTTLLLAGLVLALARPATAEDAKKKAPEAAKAAGQVASFKVDGLDQAVRVKKLSKALAGHPGVSAAKVDDGRFKVQYDPAKTTPDAIRAKLAKVEPSAALDVPPPAAEKKAETPVFQPGHGGGGCGGCPFKDSCGGH